MGWRCVCVCARVQDEDLETQSQTGLNPGTSFLAPAQTQGEEPPAEGPAALATPGFASWQIK